MGENGLVLIILLGVGVAFLGGILLTLINIASKLARRNENSETAAETAPGAGPKPAAQQPVPTRFDQPDHEEPIPNRQQFIAAVSAAIATYMGSDISGLRIHSITKV